MPIENLTDLEIIEGIAVIIQVLVATLVGLKIASVYFKTKQITFMTIGLMMIFLNASWWASLFSFISFVLFHIEVSSFVYLFVTYGIVPVPLILWMYSFSTLVYPVNKPHHKQGKVLYLSYLIVGLLYGIFFIAFIFTDLSLIGSRKSLLDSDASLYVLSFVLFSLFSSLITNYIFYRNCLKSDAKRTQWQGRFILISLILFTIGAILDASVTLTPFTLITIRILLAISSCMGYIGWTMPNIIVKRIVNK